MRNRVTKLLKLIVNFFITMLIHRPKLTLVILFIPIFLAFYNSQMEVNRQSLIIADYHSKQATTSTNDKSKKVKDVPDNLVKVPDTYFKTKEHVQALFSQVGLKVEFVPKNFDDAAKINKRNIYMGDSYQLESQPNLQYLDSDEYGDNYGYYAPKGSTIVVGYTDHDYYYKDDRTDEKSLSSQSSSTSSTSSQSSTQPSTGPVTDADIEAIKTYNDYIEIYGKIANNYYDNAQKKLDEYGLSDDATFQSMKEGIDQGVQQQKDAYGSMGTKKLMGKEELVKFLKEYRDELQTFVDSIGQ